MHQKQINSVSWHAFSGTHVCLGDALINPDAHMRFQNGSINDTTAVAFTCRGNPWRPSITPGAHM